MPKRLPNGLAWTLLGLTVVLLAVNVVFGLTGGESWTAVFGFIPATLSFALVGALIAVRAGNRLGWLFLAGATVTALSVAAKAYAARTPAAALPGAAWAGWVLTVSLGVTGTFFFLTPLLFPDGRPPSPRWRPVVWVAVLAGLAEAVASAVSDVNFYSDFPHLRDPVVLVAPLGRLISRTLAYVIVTGLLVGVYTGLVILAAALGFSTPPAVAIATLAAAALFSPLRRRVQRAVDKRFNRVRYDAELTVAAFATRLRDAVDLDTVRAELLGVVDSAVQPVHLSVWTAEPGRVTLGPPRSVMPVKEEIDMTRIAVAGATGRVGRHVVDVLHEGGHDVVAISRANGVDVITGDGLAAALEGVEVIIDTSTGPSAEQGPATEFFLTATRNLEEEGAKAGVRRLVLVSIIGVDKSAGGYGAAKLAQERAVLAGPIPGRILRAAQFDEFVEVLMGWGRRGDVVYLPPMRTQIVAARTVAEALAALALSDEPEGERPAEIAGPREEYLPDLAQLVAAKRGEQVKIEAVSNTADPDDALNADGGLLPGPHATLAGPTFAGWLDAN